MVESESCALCLTTQSKWFLEVFCEDNQSKDIAVIIAKHLWFDLKPAKQTYVCADCWKSVHDFHLFYTKLERIHHLEEENTEPSTNNAKNNSEPHEDFEFHPVETIKLEPLEHDFGDETAEPKQEEQTNEKVENESETDRKKERPRRSNVATVKYKSESSDNEWDAGAVKEEEQKTNDDTKAPHAAGDTPAPDVPVKRGRGRPPKRKLDEHGSHQPSASYGATQKVRKRRARKRIDSLSSSDSELDDASDFERREWKKLRAKSKKDRGKPLGSRQMRDKRIFSYVDEFFCYYCPEKVLFERFHHANQHYKRVHDEPAFLRCPKCGKKCFTPGGFVSHMETHDDPEKNKESPVRLQPVSATVRAGEETGQTRAAARAQDSDQEGKGRDLELLAFYKRIYCEVCEEAKPESTSFDNFWDLKVHMGNEHNKTPYLKCPICFKKNACRQQLMVHVDVHNNPEHYRCEVCKEIHQNLEKHMIKAHSPETTIPDEKNYSCEHCGKMFKFKTNLRSHIDRVHGVKDVCCNICNKYFNHKALSAHKRSAHTDEMFMCEHCPKMFKTRSGLESHKGDHDENQRKSVKCTLCGKEMRRGASMAKHMKTIHSQEDPVNCNLCGKVFRTSFHMMRHRANTCAATISSRPYKCEVCGKGFAMKLTMTEHMTTHTRTSLYQCAFCFKTFGYISNLYKHRKKAHPLEWQEVQARPEQVGLRPTGCAICQHDIAPSQRFQALCGHTFHRSCLAVWMRTYAFCPECSAGRM
ncbi:AGAP003566-PA-like protein [Anopheles sinensis]|uniref:AGAP003566-PA-like protein n=1 Tax=Anopheles sinensis TaxID=74873 RepID=A0A084VDY3_ANOSI|nr:AGAP003566-PA-like protein [Anopheles sinensis]